VPLIAFGGEKYFAKNASIRFEAEYTFGKSKSKDWGNPAVTGSTKLTEKETISLRALMCFNIGAWKR
jgi:hypothetical protein